MTASPIVDLPAIADRLGVPVETVDEWRATAVGFPPPDHDLTIGPVWKWSTIRMWTESSGWYLTEGNGIQIEPGDILTRRIHRSDPTPDGWHRADETLIYRTVGVIEEPGPGTMIYKRMAGAG